jgi:hypothetical protein
MAGLAIEGKPADRPDAITRDRAGSQLNGVFGCRVPPIPAPRLLWFPELSLFLPARRPLTASGAWATCGSAVGA